MNQFVDDIAYFEVKGSFLEDFTFNFAETESKQVYSADPEDSLIQGLEVFVRLSWGLGVRVEESPETEYKHVHSYEDRRPNYRERL